MTKSVSSRIISGTVKIPASKSMAQRAFACALLAEGKSVISNVPFSDDVVAAMGICRALGASILLEDDTAAVTGGLKNTGSEINCGEAGLSMRMFSPIAALLDAEITVTGRGSLLKRPVTMVVETLSAAGVHSSSNNGLLPLKIKGPLKAGLIKTDGSISSQFITGLLTALPYAAGDSVLEVLDLKSRPYVDMTISLLKRFGVTIMNEDYERFIIKGPQRFIPADYEIEGDWSSASFPLTAAAIGGEVTVTGLDINSFQADKAILDVLEKAGAVVRRNDNEVFVKNNKLNAFEFDATDCPDLFPPIAVLAARCTGVSAVKGAGRLAHKESDRGLVLKNELAKAGIQIDIEGDIMKIHGGTPVSAKIHSNHDHRIAMAGAILSAGTEIIVEIEEPLAVNKSYPEFYEQYKMIGGTVE